MKDMEIIDEFEKAIAEYCGAKYGVAVSSGSNAIFLSLLYQKYIGELTEGIHLTIPKETYLSVPCAIINAGFKVRFENIKWSGIYNIEPTYTWDCATRFEKDMFVGGYELQCLSFQYRKHIPIGRGGMVITDNKDAYEWLRQARHDGKHFGVSKWDDKLEIVGWDMYMTPEQAARGLALFNGIKNEILPDCGCWRDYPDVSKQKVFQ